MTKKERAKFIRDRNPLLYYKVICPVVHMDLLGFTRPCNIFELMHLVGSEKGCENFENGDYDASCVSYIPLRRLISHKIKLNDAMLEQYPWMKLAESIKEEGIRIPIIAMDSGDYKYLPIEGRHRVGAASIAYYPDFDVKIPTIIVKIDEIYTTKMYKQKHPNPMENEGFIKYESK